MTIISDRRDRDKEIHAEVLKIKSVLDRYDFLDTRRIEKCRKWSVDWKATSRKKRAPLLKLSESCLNYNRWVSESNKVIQCEIKVLIKDQFEDLDEKFKNLEKKVMSPSARLNDLVFDFARKMILDGNLEYVLLVNEIRVACGRDDTCLKIFLDSADFSMLIEKLINVMHRPTIKKTVLLKETSIQLIEQIIDIVSGSNDQ